MGSVRNEEIQSHRVATTSSFDCPHCIRLDDSRYSRFSKDQEAMLTFSERLSTYNDRRYLHYLNDFADAEDLRQHLIARCRYWCPGRGPELDAAIVSIESIVAWWETAKRVRSTFEKGKTA